MKFFRVVGLMVLLLAVAACATTGESKVCVKIQDADSSGFVSLLDGGNLDAWNDFGKPGGYLIKDNVLIFHPKKGTSGRLYTKKEYGDFVLRFEFKVTENANNGLAVRAPLQGNAAYAGMELQILDNKGSKYTKLKEYQYHGSIYGVVAAKRGFQKPVGEWNAQEVTAHGSKIKVVLNGTTIVDADMSEFYEKKTPDGKSHQGLKNEKGYLGFLGHGSHVEFRNIEIKEI